jgi:hypothetical protein
MNKDEIIKLIEDNGLTLHGDIEHFAALVEAAEREACAKVCEDSVEEAGDELAWQIRARGNS